MQSLELMEADGERSFTYSLRQWPDAAIIKLSMLATVGVINNATQDHIIALTLNGDTTPGRYRSSLKRLMEGEGQSESDRCIQLAYIGYQQTGCVLADFTLAKLRSRRKNCVVTGSVVHENPPCRNYALLGAGAYHNHIGGVDSITITLFTSQWQPPIQGGLTIDRIGVSAAF